MLRNSAGVLGIRTTSRDAASPQPFVGIVDCGASFSAVNWAAARLLGLLQPNGDLKGKRGPDILSLGVDGRPVPYPTTSVSFTFAGKGERCGLCLNANALVPRDSLLSGCGSSRQLHCCSCCSSTCCSTADKAAAGVQAWRSVAQHAGCLVNP
jgi:hypothetical protein